MEVIPNPVELDAFAPQTSTPQQRAQIREQYHIPQDATVACFVGRLGREKSVDVLLRFWAQEMKPQDNMRLLIIGDGPEKEPLEQLAQQLGITDTVVFTGKVLHPDLPTSTPATSMSPPPFRTPTPSRCWKGWQAVCRCCSCTTS